MKKADFNAKWQFVKGYVPSLKVLQMYGKQAQEVTLPHDAMIHEMRDENTKSGGATGFYPGGMYTYFKTFSVPEDWEEKTVLLEFEGVYETAMVYINGALAKTNRNGYTNFYVDIARYLNFGEENEIKVVADNSAEENSRWYSGSGIYRGVSLYVGEPVQIPLNGVRITTEEADKDVAVVEISTKVLNRSRKKEKLTIIAKLEDEKHRVYEDRVHLTGFAESENTVHQQIAIEHPMLWNCDTPHLYQCTVQIYAGDKLLDEQTISYGIRKITLDALRGLRINGEPVKLRGTCVHHDHGILGAAAYEDAELRKCRLIKEAGFNSIRSAHHPAGKAFLDACDKVGLLVMDELTDMWTVHKNNHDFAFSFLDEYQNMIKNMVEKDYNHACVILYSVGNEIQEIGTERGAELNRMLCNAFKELDSTRFTTNGMNALNAAGAKVYPIMQELAPLIRKDAEKVGTNDNSGSNVINSFMKLMEGEAGDAFAAHPIITEVLEESSESMDIIGLNYLTGRHLLEGELHPNKCVLGTETFPADIARLWKVVNSSNRVLGDFTWTGYDYLGEAGCGIFYYDGKSNFGSHYPDRTAYIGDIDLAGYRRPVSFFREIVYGLRTEPYIAVERVDKYGKKCSKTPWMFKDNIASWTWRGYEGKPAVVDVYSNAPEVELFLNGRSLGRKPAGAEHGFTATFELNYEPGVLEAASYQNGMETGRCQLGTADEDVQIHVEADKKELQANGEDLCFLTMNLCDAKGTANLYEKRRIHIEIEGEGILAAFGNADPQSIESYDASCWETYDGYALAAVRAGDKKGAVSVTVWMEGKEEQKQKITIPVN